LKRIGANDFFVFQSFFERIRSRVAVCDVIERVISIVESIPTTHASLSCLTIVLLPDSPGETTNSPLARLALEVKGGEDVPGPIMRAFVVLL